MSATSLKLPDELKRRIVRMARKAGQTPHAFMVDALTHVAARAELRERFASEAEVSECETLATGKAVALAVAFDYLESRAAGKKVRRPTARSGRASQ